MAEFFNCEPFATMLGAKVVELDEGYAKVGLTLGPQHISRINRPHGGVIAGLLDHTCGCAFGSTGRGTIGVELSICYIAGPKPGDTLTAEARIVHFGGTMGTVEAVATASDGTIIAKALCTAIALREK